MIKCPKCGFESAPSALRCAQCASPLPGLRVATALLTPAPLTELDSDTGMPPPVGHSGLTTGPTAAFTPGQTFGQRYHIISLLGVGGMGAVYHVWDVELGMAV